MTTQQMLVRLLTISIVVLVTTSFMACTSTEPAWHPVEPEIIGALAKGFEDQATDRDREPQIWELLIDCDFGEGPVPSKRLDYMSHCRSLEISPSHQVRVFVPYRQPITLPISEFPHRDNAENDDATIPSSSQITAVHIRDDSRDNALSNKASFGLGAVAVITTIAVLFIIE